MAAPNQEQKDGKLRKRTNKRVQRLAFERYQKLEARAAQRAENEVRGPEPTHAKPPQPPPAPKYGPYRQRAESEADLRFGPAMRASATQQQQTAGYFQNYQDQLKAAQVAMATRYSQATGQLGAPTVGPVVQSAEGDAAAKSRAILDRAATQNLEAQQLAQADYLTGRTVVGAAAQLSVQQQAAADAAGLTADRAAFVQQRKGELKDDAWKRKLEAKAFGLDVAKADLSAAQAQVDDRRADRALDIQERGQKRTIRKSRNAVNQYGYRNGEWQRMSTAERQAAIKSYKQNTALPKDPKTPAELTPAQQRAAQEKRNTVRTRVDTVAARIGDIGKIPRNIKDPKTGDVVKTRPPLRDEILARARDEGFSQDEIIVALAIRHGDDTWDARTRAAAKRLGYGVPKQFRPKVNKSPNLGDQRGEASK